MVCIGTLLALPSPAIAARGEPPSPEKLWKAFPLNPTGERIETTQRVETQRPVTQPDAPRHERPFVPPTTEAIKETSGPASDGNPRLLVGATALVLLGAGLLALRLRRADHSRSPTANEGGSARLLALPAIGLVALYALYGYGIYTLVSTLVHLL